MTTSDELGHDYSKITVEPTCISQGYTLNYCSRCGAGYTDEYTEPTGHNYVYEVIEPTCKAVGYTEYTCAVCGYSYADDFTEMTEHEYESEIVEPTCTGQGYTVYHCHICEDEYYGEYVSAIGHDYVTYYKYPTCIAYGYSEHVCNNCGERYITDYVAPLGHDYEKEVIKANDFEPWYTKYTCKTCGYSYLTDFVTSGDNGYIEGGDSETEEPTEPTETENTEDPPEQQGDEPNGETGETGEEAGEPTGEEPSESEQPLHEHVYGLTSEIDEDGNKITFSYKCACGEDKTDELEVYYFSADGSVNAISIISGIADYSSLKYGSYSFAVTINGETLDTLTVDIRKPPEENKDDETASENKTDDTDVFIEFGDGEDVANGGETADESDGKDDTSSRNYTGLIVFLVITLSVLVCGICFVVVRMKGKKGKNKG